ncbi:MAG: hypothetical protein HY274_10380 [Gammaproteobacteria bacterium]|nr:hypothetical protein [Gammaproteobacteria bacterium]
MNDNEPPGRQERQGNEGNKAFGSGIFFVFPGDPGALAVKNNLWNLNK